MPPRSKNSQPPPAKRSALVGPAQAGASRTAGAGAVEALERGGESSPTVNPSIGAIPAPRLGDKEEHPDIASLKGAAHASREGEPAGASASRRPGRPYLDLGTVRGVCGPRRARSSRRSARLPPWPNVSPTRGLTISALGKGTRTEWKTSSKRSLKSKSMLPCAYHLLPAHSAQHCRRGNEIDQFGDMVGR